MRENVGKVASVVLLMIMALSGCAAVGAGAGGYAGYELGCKDDQSREECAAATGAGAVGGAILGSQVD